MIILQGLLLYLSFSYLLLSMRNYQRVLNRFSLLSTRQLFIYRSLGCGTFVCTVWLVLTLGWAMGLVVFCGLVTFCGTLLALLFSYRPALAVGFLMLSRRS